jgi:diguanylate cyclase (GGDEF)-like protein
MRLIDRRDAGLATALVVGTFVLFNRPLQSLFELAASVERTYNLALVPALTVLAATLAFHQYKVRREVAEEARRALARTEEAERLLKLGWALAESLEADSIRQTLHRLLPTFCGDRKYWMLRSYDRRWSEFLGTPTSNPFVSGSAVGETPAQVDAMGAASAGTAVSVGDDLCFALVADERMVGVLGVSDRPPLNQAEKSALTAVAALVALALRNLEVLNDTWRLAIKDGLTGCVTRTHGLERLQAELARGNRTGRPVSLLLLDIDDFKTINDTAGHQCGDLVLESLGRVLADVVRASDVCCRIGGDEFLVVLPDTPDTGAVVVAEKIRQRIALLRFKGLGHGSVSISVGYATSAFGEVDSLALMHRADRAMYRAKAEGRNRTCGPDEAPASTEQPKPQATQV